MDSSFGILADKHLLFALADLCLETFDLYGDFLEFDIEIISAGTGLGAEFN